MTIRTVDDLIDVLKAAPLLSPSRMDVLLMSLRAGFVSPALLAEDLVLKHWLTLYQVTEVFHGRARRLVLGKYVLLDRLGAGGPDYLAPEQAEDPWKVDGRADVYGLGCTLYFLLAGRPPFPGGSAEDKLRRHREARPARLERLRPDLPPELAGVVRRTLRKRAAARIQTLQEMAEALVPFC